MPKALRSHAYSIGPNQTALKYHHFCPSIQFLRKVCSIKELTSWFIGVSSPTAPKPCSYLRMFSKYDALRCATQSLSFFTAAVTYLFQVAIASLSFVA